MSVSSFFLKRVFQPRKSSIKYTLTSREREREREKYSLSLSLSLSVCVCDLGNNARESIATRPLLQIKRDKRRTRSVRWRSFLLLLLFLLLSRVRERERERERESFRGERALAARVHIFFFFFFLLFFFFFFFFFFFARFLEERIKSKQRHFLSLSLNF